MTLDGNRPVRPRARVLYHYLYPDDAVSARHFDDLCQGLVARGWEVEARPSNRGCRNESSTYPRSDCFGEVRIDRVWRPGFPQSSTFGRIANALWMIAGWSLHGLAPRRSLPDVLIVGTDPIFSATVSWVWRRLRSRVRYAHWAFDLYPEAAIADGLVGPETLAARLLKWMMARVYRSYDVIADIGPCMRKRLERYHAGSRQLTLTPWALVEPESIPPPPSDRRQELFGDAALGILFSGNYGRAHFCEPFLALADHLVGESVRFAFTARGNCSAELEKSVRAAGPNVTWGGFVPESELLDHLAAADVHLVSLRQEWTGTVVPSKFFGSLACGRPVVFAGSEDSSVAQWIREHRVGWVLTAATLESVAQELRELARDRSRLAALQNRCFAAYRAHFSKRRVLDEWDRVLREALAVGPLDRPIAENERVHLRP